MAIAQQKEIARLNKVISILTTNHLALIEVLQRDLAASQQTIVELDQENEELVRSIQSLSNENSELMSHLEAEVQKSDTLVLKIYQLLDERYKLGTQDLKQSVAMHTAEVNQILKKDNPRSIIGEKRCQEQVSKLQTSQSPSFSSFVNEKDIGHVGKESKRNLPRLGDKRTLENCVGSQNSEQKNSRPVRRLSHSLSVVVPLFRCILFSPLVDSDVHGELWSVFGAPYLDAAFFSHVYTIEMIAYY